MNLIILVKFAVCCIAYTQGVTYEVIQSQPGNDLICNHSSIISCHFAVNTSFIDWKIAPDVTTAKISAAQCSSTSCTVHPTFSANYGFTFDKLRGISNVTIKKVTFEQSNLEFRCDDGSTPDPMKRNVTALPDSQTTVKRNVTFGNDTELSIETECIYPADDILIKWYSKSSKGTDLIEHTQASTPAQFILCETHSDCIVANKSARVSSALNLSRITLTSEKGTNIASFQNRIFEVVIRYGPIDIPINLGSFPVQDKTETTTYSTVKLTPTPTIVISSTPTPVITPTQTIVISPTPSTVVSPTSTAVVASSSTDKTPSSTKQNFPSTPERNKSVIIASVTGGVVILIIVISICVCYMKRKRRNKKKAKKYMLSKEDTNEQENKM